MGLAKAYARRKLAAYEKQRDFVEEARARGTLRRENEEHLAEYARELVEAVGLHAIRDIVSRK